MCGRANCRRFLRWVSALVLFSFLRRGRPRSSIASGAVTGWGERHATMFAIDDCVAPLVNDSTHDSSFRFFVWFLVVLFVYFFCFVCAQTMLRRRCRLDVNLRKIILVLFLCCLSC